jgi:hypothetical protein
MRAIAGLFDTPVAVRKVIEDLSAEGFDPQLVSVFTSSPNTGTGVRTGETSEEALAAPIDTPNRDPRSSVVTSEPLAPVPTNPVTAGQLEPVVPDDRLPTEGNPPREVKRNPGKIPGGMHKALTTWGFPAGDIRHYEDAVSQGHVLVVVEFTDDQMAARVTETLRRRGVDHLLFRGYSPAKV